MSRKLFCSILVVGVVAVVGAGEALAGPIRGADTISSPQGSYSAPFDLPRMINQSGLSAAYVEGVTDFDTFVAGTTHASPGSGSDSGFTGTSGLPQVFTFDLGGAYTLDALGLWGTNNVGSIQAFNLFADTDSNLGNGGTTLLGTFVTLGQPAGDVAPGESFTFAGTTTRYLHIETVRPATLTVGIGEVVFRESAVVPEPATLALFGLGAAGLAAARRRRRLV